MQANLTVGLCNSFCMNRLTSWPLGELWRLPVCELMCGCEITKNAALARGMRLDRFVKKRGIDLQFYTLMNWTTH